MAHRSVGPQPTQEAFPFDNQADPIPIPRLLPFDQEPGFYEPAGLWLYGNVKLLEGRLGYVPAAAGPNDKDPVELEEIEKAAEDLVLASTILVTGVHNYGHMRAAVVPLRWGSPRILCVSGGFRHHLGPNLTEEPFRAARLWRYRWDSKTDLVISRRAPDKKPTFATHNPTVDRLIERIATGERIGILSPSTNRPYIG